MLFCLVVLTLLSRVASAPVSHDEYQFVASGQLLARQMLLPYLHYPFLHMPYQVAVNALAAALSDYDFLAARLLASAANLVSMLLLFGLVTRIFKQRSTITAVLAGSLAVLLLLFDPSLAPVDGRALNHALPVTLTLVSFAFYRTASSRPTRGRWLAAAGVTSGLAVGVRLSFAVVVVPFLAILALDWLRGLPSRSLKGILAYLAGLVLALLPVGLIILAAPGPFYFGNYLYIRLNTLYRQEVGFEASMNLLSKLEYFAINVLAHPVGLLLYLTLLAVSLVALVRVIRYKEAIASQALLAALLAWALLAAGFAPTPLWPQYFFAPVPFLILAAAYGVLLVPRPDTQRLAAIALVVIFIATFPLNGLGHGLAVLAQPERWVPLQVHQLALDIKQQVPSGRILSLAPIYPLEAGLGAYPTFTVGPFVWRTAPLLSAEGRRQYQLVSFHELEDLLAHDPPAAILTGLETDYGFDKFDTNGLEKPIIDYAVRHGFEPRYRFTRPFWPSTITLWVRK